jgi:hypothetical protein
MKKNYEWRWNSKSLDVCHQTGVPLIQINAAIGWRCEGRVEQSRLEMLLRIDTGTEFKGDIH